jgi:uncharacterized membrane protein YfcA
VTGIEELFGLGGADAVLSGTALVAALAGLGLLVGIASGMFGVGGAFLMTPMLAAIFRIDYTLAVGSGLCCIIGTSAGGLARHRRQGNVAGRTVLLLGAGSIVGVLLGDILHDAMKIWLGAGFTQVMHGLYIALLLTAAWLVARGPVTGHAGKNFLQRLPIGPRVDLPKAGLRQVSVPGLAGIGLFAGLLAGTLGTGGGVIIVPILIALVGLTPHLAVGTSLGVILPTAIIGVIKKGMGEGKVSLAIAVPLLVGSTVGVQIGAYICHKLHADRLRRYFALLVLAVAAIVVARLAAGLTGH